MKQGLAKNTLSELTDYYTKILVPIYTSKLQLRGQDEQNNPGLDDMQRVHPSLEGSEFYDVDAPILTSRSLRLPLPSDTSGMPWGLPGTWSDR